MCTRTSYGRSAQKLKLGLRGIGFSGISESVEPIGFVASLRSDGIPIELLSLLSINLSLLLGSKYDCELHGVPGVLGAVEKTFVIWDDLEVERDGV